MALFSVDSLKSKFEKLSSTQESIETLSHWLLFHHRHSEVAVKTWYEYIMQPDITADKKLTLLYLMNDVAQKSKRKGHLEFVDNFGKILPQVCSIDPIWSQGDPNKQLLRLLTIWEERQVFPKDIISECRPKVNTSVPTVLQPSPVHNTITIGQLHIDSTDALHHKKLRSLVQYLQKWSSVLLSMPVDCDLPEEERMIHSRFLTLLQETMDEQNPGKTSNSI
jgi:hypothetical protein